MSETSPLLRHVAKPKSLLKRAANNEALLHKYMQMQQDNQPHPNSDGDHSLGPDYDSQANALGDPFLSLVPVQDSLGPWTTVPAHIAQEILSSDERISPHPLPPKREIVTWNTDNPQGEDKLWSKYVLTKYFDYLRLYDHRSYEIAERIIVRLNFHESDKANVYWDFGPDGTRKLHHEWSRLFRRQAFLIQYAPVDVQLALLEEVERELGIQGSGPANWKTIEALLYWGSTGKATAETLASQNEEDNMSEPPPSSEDAMESLDVGHQPQPSENNVRTAQQATPPFDVANRSTLNDPLMDMPNKMGETLAVHANYETDTIDSAKNNGKEYEDANLTHEATRKRKRAIQPTDPSTRQAVANAQGQPVPARNKVKAGIKHHAWPQERIFWWLMQNPGKTLDDLPCSARHAPFNPVWSICTPPTVDITKLKDLKITVEEMITFFPLHTTWREFSHRLVRNSWSATIAVRFIYWSRQLNEPRALIRNTIEKQMAKSDAFKDGAAYTKSNPRPNNLPHVNVYSTGHWNKTRGLRGLNKILDEDWFLTDCASGVAILPTGNGRGAFTAALEHARAHGHMVLLSEVEDYVQRWNLDPGLPMGPNDPNPDLIAYRRHFSVSKQYCKGLGMPT